MCYTRRKDKSLPQDGLGCAMPLLVWGRFPFVRKGAWTHVVGIDPDPLSVSNARLAIAATRSAAQTSPDHE